MKRKALGILLVVLMAFSVLVLASCDETKTVTSDQINQTTFEALYNLYVEQAKDKNEAIQSYEDWLKSFRGENGIDGSDGKDGIGISSAEINEKGELILHFTDNTSINLGKVVGIDGQDGIDGEKGDIGAQGPQGEKGETGEQGPQGEPGKDGENGKDGQDGTPGKDGADGEDGQDGKDGVDGTDGKDGQDGVGIAKIEKISSEGLVDTYEITYTDGTKTTFTITNGANGTDGEDGEDGQNGVPGQDGQDGKDGVTPLLRITDGYWEVSYDNGKTWISLGVKATGEKGPQGESGKDGKDGEDGEDGKDLTLCSHEFSEWSVICSPTCESIGINYRTCIKCNMVEHDYVEKQGHTLSDVHTIINSCSEHIVMTKCSICNSAYVEEREIIVEHELTEWKELIKVTCTNDGEKSRNCANCNFYESVIVPGGHSFIDGNCERCGVTSNEYFTFSLLEDDTYSIKAADTANMPKHVVMPDAYNNKKVTKIESSAFKDCTSVELFTIPDSIISIGSNAFDNTAFYNDQKNWDYNYGVLYIGSNLIAAYNNNYSITDEYTIKSGTVVIADSAFEKCGGLKEITIPSSVSYIGKSAFPYLDHVYISDVDKWLTVTFGDDHKSHPNYLGELHILDSYGEEIHDISISNSITSIPYLAFSGCSHITSITVPSSVTYIGDNAFAFCTNLTIIKLPDSITFIGKDAFVETTYYNYSGNWKNSVLFIGNHIIKMKETFTGSYKINDGVVSIAAYAFENCKYMSEITIPSSVKGIGAEAFKGCSGLNNVYAKNVESWLNIEFGNEDSAYPNSYGTLVFLKSNGNIETNITIPNTITEIGSYAFLNCTSMTSITIPSSVSKIGRQAFLNCYNIKDVYITDIVAWNNIMFEGEDNSSNPAIYGTLHILDSKGKELKELTLPDTMTKISDNAFLNCSNIEKIVLSDNIISIGKYAFDGCENLSSITISNNINYIGEGAFMDCYNLESVYVTNLDAWLNVKFANHYSRPTYYGAILYILDENGNNVSNLIIPDGVYSIPERAFENCYSLTSVVIPDSVNSIGDYAFKDCQNLTSISIGKGTTSIGNYAFSYCTIYVVYNNSDLPFEIGSNNFAGIAKDAKVLINKEETIYVNDYNEYIITDDGFLFKYDGFSKYTLIAYVGNEDTVTLPKDINGNSYSISYMRGVTNVIIPNGVKSINDYAFAFCNSLTNITIPESVTAIGTQAFRDCTYLTNVYYTGSNNKWRNINIGTYNSSLTGANIHYNYVPEE